MKASPTDAMDRKSTRDIRYCLSCGYRLHDIESSECPECGRAFDRSNLRTTSAHPFVKSIWRSLAYLWWCLTFAIGVVAVIAIFYSGLGYDPLVLWLVGMALVPFMGALLILTVLPWIHVRARSRIWAVLAIALFLSIAFFSWPLRFSFMLHKSAMDRYVDQINDGTVKLKNGSMRIGSLAFVNVTEYDGNIGFQTTGGGGGGTFLVCHDPTSTTVWVNTNWEIDLGDNWFFVYQD